ncbi:MAG: hypothetical protein G3M78_13900 [Candidatus Nitrohelix vancouverensis]|uniref:Thiol:disulfide interchange protein DsbD N-terminal domain-containing protein n=1 Tax=Candidatus Nitrohelix vancouverensis TaxID=2705534 RepID=A0A7T0C4H8_9BACT|nr:MAG: hypothetical protein G3M78_13900 [Candidatus Nitrohelix vancouverensis]
MAATRIAFLIFLFSWNVEAFAFDPAKDFGRGSKENHVHVDAMADPNKAVPGDLFELRIWLEMDEGWHIYSLESSPGEKEFSTRIEIFDSRFLPQGNWREPSPEIMLDGALGRVVKTHKNLIEFRRHYWVPRNMAEGRYPLLGSIEYRACDNRICTLPTLEKFTANLQILNPSLKLDRVD